MSSINSLINPPEEPQVVVKQETEVKAEPTQEVQAEAEPEPKSEPEADVKQESPEKNDAKAAPTVSQDTILNSFDKIKTHFPAARIKKIMQSDEDIGKVAQATPVVVGRALEIFMANLVEAAIIEAKEAGVRRIAASHVRAAVEDTEQFDFLVDVVSKYPSLKH